VKKARLPAPAAIAQAVATTRQLTTVHATALIVASMIGTGIFTTTGVLLASLPSPPVVLAVWALSGLLALCGAAVYAELGAMMPRAGGEYVYTSRAFGPAVGFLSGWISLFVGFAAPTAAGALAFGQYLHAVAPAVSPKIAALALLVVLTAVHMTHVRVGAGLQTVLAALVVALVIAFIVAALGTGQGDWSRLTAAGPPADRAAHTPAVTAGGIAVGLVYVSYAYAGWNGAAMMTGELRDPARALPRALALGTGLVTALYLALNALFLWSAPVRALAGQVEVAHVSALALFGARGASLLSSLVALALAGFVSAMLLSGPRVTLAMAEDGLFFRMFARTNRRGAPPAAVALQGALAIAFAATAAFDPILVYVGFTLTLNAAATVLGAFLLRRREPDAARPHRALGWPVSGLLFLALSAFMLVLSIRERPAESAAGLVTLASGAAVHAFWRRRAQAG
jgi:APA family basic amino acid/polyamine antiporter